MSNSYPISVSIPPRRAAKKLLQLLASENAAAVARMRAIFHDCRGLPDGKLPAHCGLQRCQHVIALDRGFSSWEDLLSGPSIQSDNSLVLGGDSASKLRGSIGKLRSGCSLAINTTAAHFFIVSGSVGTGVHHLAALIGRAYFPRDADHFDVLPAVVKLSRTWDEFGYNLVDFREFRFLVTNLSRIQALQAQFPAVTCMERQHGMVIPIHPEFVTAIEFDDPENGTAALLDLLGQLANLFFPVLVIIPDLEQLLNRNVPADTVATFNDVFLRLRQRGVSLIATTYAPHLLAPSVVACADIHLQTKCRSETSCEQTRLAFSRSDADLPNSRLMHLQIGEGIVLRNGKDMDVPFFQDSIPKHAFRPGIVPMGVPAR